ncbi:MAG: hypothetical protein WA584_23570 [Pyrinomonadaceae bacterium]
MSKSLDELKNHYGVRPKMCENCAFRMDSPEVGDFAAPFDDIAPQLQGILCAIDVAVEGDGEFKPFFCHQEMPTSDGGATFQPEFSDLRRLVEWSQPAAERRAARFEREKVFVGFQSLGQGKKAKFIKENYAVYEN